MSSADMHPTKRAAEAMAELQQHDVDDLCARDPLAARTRMMLLKLEKNAHRLGWDHPNNIGTALQVQYNPGTHHVEQRPSDAFTDIIRRISDQNGGHIGLAFQELATVAEGMVKGQFDYRLPPKYRNVTWSRPGFDVWEGDRPGWRFYGYGYLYEAWMAEQAKDERGQNLRNEHRIETRQICLAARDGRLWCLSRIRGEQPTLFVEQADAAGSRIGGNVVNALSRLTNVVAGNPVPIRPRDPTNRRD